MKHIFLFFPLILFHLFTYSQPKIDMITWVGQNNEYLNISKKTASLQKDSLFYQFNVVKYVKNNYIIFSHDIDGGKSQWKYNIVYFTKDTLILATEEVQDVFNLTESIAEPNEQGQYVFVNSLRTFKFESFYFETSFKFLKTTKKVILYIDSDRRSRILVQDDLFEETKASLAPINEDYYEHLIKILSSCDISCLSQGIRPPDDKNEWGDSKLEIMFNNQVKTYNTSKEGIYLPLIGEKLYNFIWEYIDTKVIVNGIPAKFLFYVY